MERVGCRGNTSDMDVQPFYQFIQRTYPWHVVASFAALYALGGLPALVRPLSVLWDFVVLLIPVPLLQAGRLEGRQTAAPFTSRHSGSREARSQWS
jgi:hypothetical protein